MAGTAKGRHLRGALLRNRGRMLRRRVPGAGAMDNHVHMDALAAWYLERDGRRPELMWVAQLPKAKLTWVLPSFLRAGNHVSQTTRHKGRRPTSARMPTWVPALLPEGRNPREPTKLLLGVGPVGPGWLAYAGSAPLAEGRIHVSQTTRHKGSRPLSASKLS